jgi:transcriptional regulator with XRE-family HTH domain
LRRVDPREIRRKLGLNQQQFWSKIGVTQSGGSRYESGRNMPKPVRELLRLVHVEQIDIQRLKREDFEVVEYLKAEDPDLFKTLRKAARSKLKKPAALPVRCTNRFASRHQLLPGALSSCASQHSAGMLASDRRDLDAAEHAGDFLDPRLDRA